MAEFTWTLQTNHSKTEPRQESLQNDFKVYFVNWKNFSLSATFSGPRPLTVTRSYDCNLNSLSANFHLHSGVLTCLQNWVWSQRCRNSRCLCQLTVNCLNNLGGVQGNFPHPCAPHSRSIDNNPIKYQILINALTRWYCNSIIMKHLKMIFPRCLVGDGGGHGSSRENTRVETILGNIFRISSLRMNRSRKCSRDCFRRSTIFDPNSSRVACWLIMRTQSIQKHIEKMFVRGHGSALVLLILITRKARFSSLLGRSAALSRLLWFFPFDFNETASR